MLQPVYTMHGFNWFDRRGTEGVGFIRALRTLLTNNVPNILPELSAVIKTQFDEMSSSHGRGNSEPAAVLSLRLSGFPSSNIIEGNLLIISALNRFFQCADLSIDCAIGRSFERNLVLWKGAR